MSESEWTIISMQPFLKHKQPAQRSSSMKEGAKGVLNR